MRPLLLSWWWAILLLLVLGDDSGNTDDPSPTTIGSLKGARVVKATNGTNDFPSDFFLSINDSDADTSLSADISAMTTTTGVSLTNVNGMKSICSGKLLLVKDGSDVDPSAVIFTACDDQEKSSDILDAIGDGNPTCTIMYSLTSRGCNLTDASNSLSVQLGTMFTMLNRAATQSILSRFDKGDSLSVIISPNTTTFPTNSPDKDHKTPTGPKVAMAILYSATGIIAAAFLFVIISGAIRAHKHPERYGLTPLGGNGENNNDEGFGSSNGVYANRAKGIARAVLDSIPLVTFRMDNNNNEENDKQPKELQPIQNNNNNNTNESCPICFEDFIDGEVMRILPCKHKFHAICVDPWLLNSSSQCPLCRVDLSLQNNEEISNEPPSNENENNNNNNVEIPPGYEVETSRFNRFLDVWNAQLLPRDARRRALSQFQQEADLRRQLRSRRDSTMEEQNRNLWIRFVNSRRRLFNRNNNNE